jgi:hypothetical protein
MDIWHTRPKIHCLDARRYDILLCDGAFIPVGPPLSPRAWARRSHGSDRDRTQLLDSLKSESNAGEKGMTLAHAIGAHGGRAADPGK